MKRLMIAIATTAVVLGMNVVAAQQDEIKSARDVMKANGKNMGTVLTAMAKGDKPYDQAAVDAALNQLDDTAKKLPTLYPASMKGQKFDGDYSPSPKVWDDKAAFDAEIAKFGKVVTDAKAKIKDLDSLKATVPGIGKECGSCHETFRVKNS